ncbi:MAG: ribonuclease H family protein [Bacteroidota bacterium]|nr:ribonuclease H family protein [Bacteroidota bacterium]
MGKTKKFYVVWSGAKPGIYESWDKCKRQIQGFPAARYKSFPSQEMAEEAFKNNPWKYIGKNVPKQALSAAEKRRIGTPNKNSISVDAACSGNPGPMEYQGVRTNDGEKLFHLGPLEQGTVNIGEFLALVHGLAFLKQRNSNLPIYSDSITAMKWVRDKKTNTKLQRTAVNDEIFVLMERAVKWLQNNTYENKIVKWETKIWGEIPADFGRK